MHTNTTNARLPFTGFRIVNNPYECKLPNVTYYVNGVFYQGSTPVSIADVPQYNLLQMVLLSMSKLCDKKPDQAVFGDIYLDGTVYRRFNGVCWQEIDPAFVDRFLRNSLSSTVSSTAQRDKEAKLLSVATDNTTVLSTNDLFIRKGVWNPAKNEPVIADGDDHPNFSVYLVLGSEEKRQGGVTAVSFNQTVVTKVVSTQLNVVSMRNVLPENIAKEGVNNMDFVVKIGDVWRVVHNTKLPSASDISYGKNKNVKEALDEMSKRIDDNHEVRFGTFRGYVDNEVSSLENGAYVVNRKNGQVYYSQGGQIMATNSGFVPNFNGRYGDVGPQDGDYTTAQVSHENGNLADKLVDLDKKVGKAATVSRFVTRDSMTPPEAPTQGDMCYVLEKVVTDTWGDSGYVTYNPGDLLIYTDVWVHVPSGSGSSGVSSVQLKMGGKFSENSENAAEGAVLVVDKEGLDWPVNTLLIKTGPDEYVNAFPEVVTAESVSLASQRLKATNVSGALDEIHDMFSSMNKNVGVLHFTSTIPDSVAYSYQPHDYGFIDKFVAKGYIYNGAGYSELTNVCPGTVMMLSRSNKWVVLWSPPKMLKVIKSEDELTAVEWDGPTSYVYMAADTKNYKYGDLITQSGSCLDDSHDAMFDRGAFFDSPSVRMCLRQLDYALEFYMFVPKRRVGVLTTEGWNSAVSDFKAGDYLVCSGMGKVASTSPVIPNQVISETTIALYDGSQWNLIGTSSTTDMITHGSETLSAYLDREIGNKIVSIGKFIDLTNAEDLDLVKQAPAGRVYKVAVVSPEFPEISRGDYVGAGGVGSKGVVVRSPAVDLSNTPCHFDPDCLSLEEYLCKVKTTVQSLPAGTHFTLPVGTRRAWSNGTLTVRYADDGSMTSVGSSDKIFLEVTM